MRYTDRSRTETDWTCPRARFWEYEYQGRGLRPVEPNADLTFGLTIAALVEQVRQGQQPPLRVGTQEDVLASGLIEAYRTRIWPEWLNEYELMGTELECTWPLTADLTYMARPDAVLKRKSDETYWYLDDKTTSQRAENWAKQWDKAVQMHATGIAIEHTTGWPIMGSLVQGWVKGYQKGGTIYSPLCHAWCKEGQPGMTKDQWKAEYVYGWPRRVISHYPGGVAAWVKQLPLAVVLQQFPVAGPIMLRRDLVEIYVDELVRREDEMRSPQASMARVFPHRFSQCDEFGKFRRPCAHRDCCWAPTVGRDPVGSGMFTWREPHHQPEKEQTHDAQ